MGTYGMRWITLDNLQEAKSALTQIGADSHGVVHMMGKAVGRGVKLEQVPLRVAHILKQEMLSLGGDAAVHRNVIVGSIEATDVLLLGSVRQLNNLAAKILAQPFGLKEVGQALKKLLAALEPKTVRTLSCRGLELTLGERTLVMGILNVTPDSFFDGGRYDSLEKIIAQGKRLAEEGADMIDVGAESTRPGHAEISQEEEWLRLEPVLAELCRQVRIPISIDTQKAWVAEKALQAGVHLVNDVWGLQKDPAMAGVAGKYQAPVILMHNQKGAVYHHLMGEILAFLTKSIQLAEAGGLSGDQIILDPGIGFGKTKEQSLEVIARLAELKTLGHPVLLGVSRKGVIGKTLDLPVEDRLEGTLAASVLGAAAGVDIIRVHDVQANCRAVQMADAVVRGQRGWNYVGA